MIATRSPLRRRRWLPTVAALAVLAIAATVTVAARAGTTATAMDSAAAARWSTPAAPVTAPTTADLLYAAANRTQTPAADQQAGSCTYHHLRRWILDTTGTPAPRPNTPAVFRIEIKRWNAADGSGLGLYTELPPAYDLTGAQPDHRSSDGEFARTRPTRTTYGPGTLSSPIAGPLPTDPDTLARRLAFDPMPDGPQATLRAVDELYTSHHVTRLTRSSVLRVLARVPGLRYQADATDRLGRHGFALSLDARTDTGELRFTLIFDTTTGQLLASSQQLLGPHTHLPVPAGLVTYYTLFVDQGHADLGMAPPAGPR